MVLPFSGVAERRITAYEDSSSGDLPAAKAMASLAVLPSSI
jgi:hypothetical protein